MERQVLIISPRFPPINAPDHHRVRMALPYMCEWGWRPTVITVRPSRVDGVEDPLLGASIGKEIEIVRVNAIPSPLTRALGFGGLSYRVWPYLRRVVGKLLQERSFVLIFFSTTESLLFACGPAWKKRHRIPYILDFQDPWQSDYFKDHPKHTRPGGRFKYAMTQALAKRLEPNAVRQAAHLIAVSPDYPNILRQRYPSVPAEHFTVLPFAAAASDMDFMTRVGVRQSIFDPHDGNVHWVYMGRGGDDMAFSLKAIFSAVKRYRETDEKCVRNWRFHFVGTDYASGDRVRKTVEPVARTFGLEDIVHEHPHRIPYFEALRCLTDADYLLILGSDDASYTASKLYPYILAKTLIAGVFHEHSTVVEIFRALRSGPLVTFKTGERYEDVAQQVEQQWFRTWPPVCSETNWSALAPYTAKAMTEKLCQVFDQTQHR
jgi:hypothetical protein